MRRGGVVGGGGQQYGPCRAVEQLSGTYGVCQAGRGQAAGGGSPQP